MFRTRARERGRDRAIILNKKTLFALTGIIAIIIIASTIGLTLFPKSSPVGQPSTSQSSNLSSVRTSSSDGQSPWSLELVNQSTTISSNLTSWQLKTPIQTDEVGLTYEGWQLSGLADLQPDVASFSANGSGFTFSDQTCDGNQPKDCGPYETWNVQHVSNFTELGAGLLNVPSDLVVFSIYVDVPYYSFFQSCSFNVSREGCSYEGSGPMLGADLELDTSGPTDSNSISVGLMEVRNNSSGTISLLAEASSDSIVCSPEGCTNEGIIPLNSTTLPSFTSLHKLTIVTNRKSFIQLYVDDTPVYSSAAVPVDLSVGAESLDFYQFTSVNNETSSTTWSNFSAYSSPDVTVSGLSQKMQVVIAGPDGFKVSSSPNSTGFAVADVALSPSDLSVSVNQTGQDEQTIAALSQTVDAGATLNLSS